jgi:hypothetical protein
MPEDCCRPNREDGNSDNQRASFDCKLLTRRSALQVADLLIGAGALSTVKDADGKTPTDLAPDLGCWRYQL